MKRAPFRQVFILLLGLFVTLGMGLSAVQASAMSFKMLDMAPGMSAPGVGECNDCGSPGDSRGLAACVTSGCVSPAAAFRPFAEVFDIAGAPVHHSHQDLTLHGASLVPDPYPPRTTFIV